MNKNQNKSSFKVPEGYFDQFENELFGKIKVKNPVNGFTAPAHYFETLDNRILNRLKEVQPERISFVLHLWKAIAVAAVFAFFFLNENTSEPSHEMLDFFIEDYLTLNTTYEIAEQSDYYFETRFFIENYASISIDDAMELRLYGETPTNLNLFEDE